jgi:hypothetical protein
VYAGPVDVTLTCTPDSSSCAGTSYFLKTASGYGPTTQYVGPIHLTETAILYFSSVDVAGHAEVVHDLRIEVLPVGAAPHLRIEDGLVWLLTSRNTGLLRPAEITLTERAYTNTGFYFGDAMEASIAGDKEYAVTGAGQPLSLYDDEESFRASGLPLAVKLPGSGQNVVRLFAGPGVARMFPLHIEVPVTPMPAWDVAPLPGSLDIPDMPLLTDYSYEGGVAPIRFTGSLLRSSLGTFDSIKLIISNPGKDGGCEEIIPRDSPMLRTVEGADIWSDVVELTPADRIAECLAAPDVPPRFELRWESPTASWVEGVPPPFDTGAARWTVSVGQEAQESTDSQ